MNRDQLYAAIDTLWGGNQNAAARDLDINIRTLRAGLTKPENSSYRKLNEGVVREIRDLLEQFPDGVPKVDPRKTIRLLHEMMQRAGWTADQSAAAILGAAHGLAKRELGAEVVVEMVTAKP